MRTTDYALAAPRGEHWRSVLELWRSVVSVAARPLWMTILLTLALAATEWVGLLLLVPLLAVANIDTAGVGVRALNGQASAIFRAFGLTPTLPIVLVIYVVAITARTALQRTHTAFSARLATEYMHACRVRLYAALTQLRWEEYTRLSGGEMMHALTDDIGRTENAVAQLPRICTDVVVGLTYLWLATRVSLGMTLLAAGAGCILLLLLRLRTTHAYAIGMRMSRDAAALNGMIHEQLGGMRTVRSFGAESRSVASVRTADRSVVDAFRDLVTDRATIGAMFTTGVVIVLSMLVYVSLTLVHLSPAAIFLLLFLFARLAPRFGDLQQSYQLLLAALPAFVRTRELIDRFENAGTPATASREPVPRLTQKLELRDVTFRYGPSSSAPQLDGVSLTIPAGALVAVTGASGSGKSTLADVILGLITPQAGEIFVDGTRIQPAMVNAWRSQVGYVSQEAFLLQDTVRANLLWGQPDASEAALRQALAQAAALSFVERLPQGLDTVLGERGATLSGGERQRVALARALVRRPALLLLDEATSALDSETEDQILNAIVALRGETTILMISHRPSTAARADVVCVLDGGRISEMRGRTPHGEDGNVIMAG